MNVIGISSGYHNSAAALCQNGELTFAATEERLTLIKGDASFPHFALKAGLQHLSLDRSEIDKVAYFEDPHEKFSRVLTSLFAEFPFRAATFSSGLRHWLTKKLWVANDISAALNIHPSKIEYVPHHVSHVAQSFLPSPFDTAAVLIVDAVGEWSCTSTGYATRENGFAWHPITSYEYPHSLGLVYSAVTGYLGFKPNSDECSTMALAAFGEPAYVDRLSKIVKAEAGGGYAVDATYFDFLSTTSAVSRRFIAEFGPPRDQNAPLSFNCGLTQQYVDSEQRRFADIACSIQYILEERLVDLATELRRRTRLNNLCIGGGVALNCVANKAIARRSGFKDLFILPDPGDGGAAVGAALAISARHDGHVLPLLSPYLGTRNNTSTLFKLLGMPERPNSIRTNFRGTNINVEKYASDDALAGRITEHLLSGKIAALTRGRAEFGPRALGNRSIICDPSRVDLAERLSLNIKRRAKFRPYALSISAKSAESALGISSPTAPEKWMLSASALTNQVLEKAAAARHIDGTTRPHVVLKDENLFLHSVLDNMNNSVGLGAILNTSFNERGYPIVATPEHAVAIFLRTQLDVLIIDDVILEKDRA